LEPVTLWGSSGLWRQYLGAPTPNTMDDPLPARQVGDLGPLKPKRDHPQNSAGDPMGDNNTGPVQSRQPSMDPAMEGFPAFTAGCMKKPVEGAVIRIAQRMLGDGILEQQALVSANRHFRQPRIRLPGCEMSRQGDLGGVLRPALRRTPRAIPPVQPCAFQNVVQYTGLVQTLIGQGAVQSALHASLQIPMGFAVANDQQLRAIHNRLLGGRRQWVRGLIGRRRFGAPQLAHHDIGIWQFLVAVDAQFAQCRVA